LVGKYDIEFIEAEAPITDPVTKFGGQPVWLERPEWPLSKELGRQMLFVCQIALDPEIFGVSPGRMTYLFITRESEDEWVDGTYDPDSGENAVIVQPGGTNDAKTVAESKGPSLYKFVDGRGWEGTVPCEYSVKLEPGEDPEYVGEDERVEWSEAEFDAFERPGCPALYRLTNFQKPVLGVYCCSLTP
jgi:hypothetical protein